LERVWVIVMKLFSLLAVCAHANQLGFSDPNDAMNQLSMLMAGSQMALGKAQRHHQKLVDRMRKSVEADFTNESETVGEDVGHFAVELKRSEAVIEAAMAAAAAGLKEEEKAPAKEDDWQDPGVAERARLNAQMNAANRTLQHLQRTNEYAVRTAEEDAGQAFDDAEMKLSMKLGDLADNSDAAKKNVSKSAEKAQAIPAAVAGQFIAKGKDQQTRLQKYEQELKESQKSGLSGVEAAKKKFAAFLARDVKEIEVASDKTLADLAKAQQIEIAKVLKHQPTMAPLKTKSQDAAHGKASATKSHAAKVSTSSPKQK